MNTQEPKRLLRLPKVLDRTGQSRSRLYADPTFPRPVKIGDRAVAWLEHEVDEWIDQRVSERPVGEGIVR